MNADLNIISEMAELLMQLWPGMNYKEAEGELREYITGEKTAAFTSLSDGKYIGLALCSLREDYVEGCSFSPVGYLEGIIVDEKHRMHGTAYSLCKECEEWAKSKGCREFASDCELNNTSSLKFHLNIGFKEVNRIICFKKTL